MVAVVALLGCGSADKEPATTRVTLSGSIECTTGCDGSQQLTARQVERAFWRAGVPFASEQDRAPANPYLRAPRQQSIALPRRAQPFAKHVTAFLIATDPVTFKSEIAYVFDSTSNAEAAVRVEPLARWMTSNNRVTTARVANVLILATTAANRVHRALSSLTQQSG